MRTASVITDETPLVVQRVPFASESGLQRFVEDHAENLFGVKVIASALRGGHRLFNIDILAADPNGRPWIIECKHDLVPAAAIGQLRGYRTALIAGWANVAPHLRSRNNVSLSDHPDPVLVLLGYRFDGGFAHDQIARVIYRYHDVEFTDDELQTQNAGRVSLHLATEIAGPGQRHPKVSKKFAMTERLQYFAPALEDSFWRIDKELRGLSDKVKVIYGGKNFVRYNTKTGIFAEAVVGDGILEWRMTSSLSMHSASDEPTLLTLLRDAYEHAG